MGYHDYRAGLRWGVYAQAARCQFNGRIAADYRAADLGDSSGYCRVDTLRLSSAPSEHSDSSDMSRARSEQMAEHRANISRWLASWLESVQAKYPLPEEENALLQKLLVQARNAPDTVVALDVGQLLHYCERNGLTTDKTPLADRAIQTLLEIGRPGAIDRLTGDMRQWFRQNYFWATSTSSLDVRTIQGDEAEELLERYFNPDAPPSQDGK